MAEPVTGGNDYDLHRQLTVVNIVTPISHSNSNSSSITPFSSPFSVPDGWIIHQVPRSNGLRVDTYYIEPETGRKFRSRNQIQRYLNFEEYQATRSRSLTLDYRFKMTSENNWVTTKFTLPEDWFVEKVPRKSGSTIDKYYHDPETGRKFRSLKDVERYLTEGVTPTRSKAKRLKHQEKHFQKCYKRKKIASSGKMLDYEENKDNKYQLINVTTTSFPSTSHFTLPDGWIVEEVPRKSGDHNDRYYLEPGSGKRFRSLTAVEKHLAELEENNLPLSKAFTLATSIKNHGSYKSWEKRKEKDCSSFKSPPKKIKWVIGSTVEETWNAFVGDTPVPDFMKQQWGKRFMLTIDNNAPISRNEPEAGSLSF